MTGYDPDYSHSIRGDVGLPEDDGYHFAHGDPEGDLARGNSSAWVSRSAWSNFHNRRKDKDG